MNGNHNRHLFAVVLPGTPRCQYLNVEGYTLLVVTMNSIEDAWKCAGMQFCEVLVDDAVEERVGLYMRSRRRLNSDHIRVLGPCPHVEMWAPSV